MFPHQPDLLSSPSRLKIDSRGSCSLSIIACPGISVASTRCPLVEHSSPWQAFHLPSIHPSWKALEHFRRRYCRGFRLGLAA